MQFIVIIAYALQNIPFNLMWAAVTLLFYLYWTDTSDFFHRISKNANEKYCTSVHTTFSSEMQPVAYS